MHRRADGFLTRWLHALAACQGGGPQGERVHLGQQRAEGGALLQPQELARRQLQEHRRVRREGRHGLPACR